ncbi:putative ribonuclease H-like domain-containing protein [Tanacetum coccineum]
MEAGTTSTTLTARLPILNLGEYDLWKYEPTSTEEKAGHENEIKLEELLLMALPNKRLQLKFHHIRSKIAHGGHCRKDWRKQGTIQTKDLQKLISHAWHRSSEFITKEDMKLKLLRSLPSEWKTHALIWRNKKGNKHHCTCNSPQLAQEDLEQIDPDDLEEMITTGTNEPAAQIKQGVSSKTGSRQVKCLFEHLHYECDKKVIRPVWNNSSRVNHKNFANKITNPHPNRRFVPQAVLTRSGQINTAGASVNTAVRPFNIPGSKTTVNHPRPILNTFKKGYSQVTRPFNKYSTNKNNIFNKKVNIVRVKDTTARDRAVVSENKGKWANAVKASACWVWKAKNSSASNTIKNIHTLIAQETHSRRSTRKKELLTVMVKVEFLEKNYVLLLTLECPCLSSDFKLLDESQVLLRVPRKDNIYSVDLKSVVPIKGLTRLFAKAAIDESSLWHWRLGRINFKNMNKLIRGNFVRGLPSKIFENDHSCVACQKGKQHKTSLPLDLSKDTKPYIKLRSLRSVHWDQQCKLAIFHDMIEESVEVFMDDFSIFRNSFDKCLNNPIKCSDVVKMLILSLIGKNATLWSKKELCLDRSPNWNLPFELMCDASDFTVGAVLENVAADHLSRIDNNESSDDSEVDGNFPGETLMEINTRNDHGSQTLQTELVELI